MVFLIGWGVGRHGPGDNVFAYFVDPFGFVIEYTAEVLQVNDDYRPHGPDYWVWPAGRTDHWGIAPPKPGYVKDAQLAIRFAAPDAGSEQSSASQSRAKSSGLIERRPELMGAEPEFDVVIVGFGPAGAVAACWLGQAGVRTLVVEKSRTIWEIPRAMALDHEILRVFQNIGVVEKILPHTAPFGASEHFGATGQLIRRIDVVAPPYPQGYLPNMVFTQPPVERILREKAEAHSSVTVALGKEVTDVEQRDDGVWLTMRDENDTIEVATARYVIGCDGASSTVRRLAKISLDDLGFDEPWLVVDVMVNDDALAKLPRVCAQYCDPARPYTYIIGPGNHRRWEIMLNPGENARADGRRGEGVAAVVAMARS